MLKESEPRSGFIEAPEFARLLDALPTYLRQPIRFLWTSGWRRGAMRSLMWTDVRFERDGDTIVGGTVTLRAANSKTGRSQRLPLTGDLLDVLTRAWDDRALGCPYVFHDRDRPRKPGDDTVHAIGDFKSSWSTACQNVGLPHLLVHDLRRSAGRNLVRSGVPESVARKITGHRTRAMFDRYDITSETDLVNALERVSDYNARRATEPLKVVPIR